LRTYNRLYGISYCILALSNVYGHRHDPRGESGVVAIFCEKMLKGEDCIIFGDGNQTRDFVYVEDVAKVIISSVEKDTEESFYNIGLGKSISINEVYKKLAFQLGIESEPKYKREIKGEVINISVDNQRMQSEFSISLTSINDGLKKTLEWYRGRGSI